MSEVIQNAVVALNERLDGGFDGTAKFVVEGEGDILIDEAGAREATQAEEAEVTMTADTETFRGILDGTTSPTAAFMAGELKVDGDMGVAMKLGAALT
jgi:putative sterol carrier protein